MLSNTSSIMWIHLAIHKISADKAFVATDSLISWLFVVAFVHATYVKIALIWGFPAQLSLWKLVHWLWRYKLNEVCDRLPKFNWIFLMGDKEISQFMKDRQSINLKGMWHKVKYLFCSMDWISNDNNFWYSRRCDSLIYSTYNSEQFSFYTIDIYYMMKGFDNRFVMNVNISNGCSHIILDTNICNDKSMRWVF